MDREILKTRLYLMIELNSGREVTAPTQDHVDFVKGCFVEDVHPHLNIKKQGDGFVISFTDEYVQQFLSGDLSLC